MSELKERALNFDALYSTDTVADIDLHKHVVDQIRLKCDACGGSMERIAEVIDCWVESASMPFAEFHYPFENTDVFKKRFPGQYIAEYIAQTRAWFYYMHVMSTLLFDSISFENCVTTGTILNEKGEKLSKSKMNYTDPWTIIGEYGVDALRYYLMTSVVMSADNLFFNDREVREVYNKVINMLWNVLEYHATYKNEEWGESPLHPSPNILDRWILSKTHTLIREVTKNMDAYDTVRAGRPIRAFIDELSTWYLRRSRERFKSDDGEDRLYARETLRQVLHLLSRVIAPFMPFMAEMMYRHTVRAGTLPEVRSVHLDVWPEANEPLIDAPLESSMSDARSVVEMIHALRSEAGIKVRQPLSEAVCSHNLSEDFLALIADEVNVKTVRVVSDCAPANGWIVKEDGQGRVMLCTILTDELRAEGMVREMIRAINAFRKEKSLTVNDHVALILWANDEDMNSLIRTHEEQLKKQTLTRELRIESLNYSETIMVNGKKISIALIV